LLSSRMGPLNCDEQTPVVFAVHNSFALCEFHYLANAYMDVAERTCYAEMYLPAIRVHDVHALH